MRLDYGKERFSKVRVCGVECGFNDMRIERSSVPEGKYQYEVVGDDCVLWLRDGDFMWL